MAVYLLHYRGDNGRRDMFMNKFAGLFGMNGLTVNLTGGKGGDYTSIREALQDKALAGHAWVWLDPKGDDGFLDEVVHPKEDVVYCIGHETVGFEGLTFDQLPGTKVQLRRAGFGEWNAHIVAPLVCYDRALFLDGRRMP